MCADKGPKHHGLGLLAVSRWSVDLLCEQIAGASPDRLQAMIKTFAQAAMPAEADAICGAGYGQRSDERVNSRNGYRPREWDTRAGTIDLAITKLRQGSHFPDWLLTHRRRAEQTLVSVVATSYLVGVSTRRLENLTSALGIAHRLVLASGRRPRISAAPRQSELAGWKVTGAGCRGGQRCFVLRF